jgi:methyl-accepting chemotaxis protein
MLNPLKIDPRLTTGFGTLLLLLCGIAGLGACQPSQINDHVIDLNDNWLQSVALLGEPCNLANESRRFSMRHAMVDDAVDTHAAA